MKNKKGYKIQSLIKKDNFEEGFICLENNVLLKSESGKLLLKNAIKYNIFLKDSKIISLIRDSELHSSLFKLKAFAKCSKYDKFSFTKGRNIAISRILNQIHGISIKNLENILENNIKMKDSNKTYLTKIIYDNIS